MNDDNVNWATAFLYLAMILPWVTGIAVSNGFWMTCGALFFPPLAWVFAAQHLLGL